MNYMVNPSELKYWNSHYIQSGTSGEGSVGKYRDWKWQTITDFIPQVNDVIDIGCGDLSFWEGRNCLKYLGIDISPSIIKKNLNLRPEWKFICSPAGNFFPNIKANTVFCQDMLFHIMSEDEYINILKNLTHYSNKWIFIYTWSNNPFEDSEIRGHLFRSFVSDFNFYQAFKSLVITPTSDGKYQYYRNFFNYSKIFLNGGFELIEVKKNPFDNFGSMFIMKKL